MIRALHSSLVASIALPHPLHTPFFKSDFVFATVIDIEEYTERRTYEFLTYLFYKGSIIFLFKLITIPRNSCHNHSSLF